MDVKLIVVGGEAKPAEIRLKLPTTLGRGREATLTLPHPLVSRQHCEIYESDDGQLVVRDLGSLNGTFVGNERITEAPLPPGELLTVGTVTFRAVYGEMPQLAPDQAPAIDFGIGDTGSIDETVPVPDEQTLMVDSLADIEATGDTEEVGDEFIVQEVEIEEVEIEEVEVEEAPAVEKSPSAAAGAEESSGEDDDDLNAFLKGLG